MKKSIFILSVVMVVGLNLRAGWNRQESTTTKNLKSVFMISPNVGWAVGEAGTILKYNGTSWVAQSSGTTKNLVSVYFTDATHGWAVGNTGTLLATTDGNNWISLVSNTTQNLNDICFADATHGWIVGDKGTIMQSDNGTSWTLKTNKPAGMQVAYSIHFGDVNNGIITGGISEAGGDSRVYITTNGGDTWIDKTSGINYPSSIVSGFVINSNEIWVTGYAKGSSGLYNYNGTTWTEDTAIKLDAGFLNGITFADSNHGWLTANKYVNSKNTGFIYKYDGTSWTEQYRGQVLNSIHFADTSDVWAVGDSGIILTTYAPPVVLPGKVTSTTPTEAGIVTLSWPLAPDSLHVVEYGIYLDGIFKGTSEINSFSLNINDTTNKLKNAALTHQVVIKAFDINNALKAVYEPVSITTIDVLKLNIAEDSGVSLYPNPSSGHLLIKCTEIISNIVILNLRGQTILQIQPKATQTAIVLDKTIAPPGMYFAKLTTTKGVSIHTVQIIR